MDKILELLFSFAILLLGFPLGFYLKKLTLDENKEGQRWFKLIIVLSLTGALISVLIKNDTLLFTFLFMAIVTGMSLKKN